MGKLLKIITPLHKSTKRDYIGRMMDDKIHCMKIALEYEFDYWDGDRRYGYGGYKYDGRWKTVAEKLIKQYKLTNKSKILDVGCGKGHLLYEIKKLLPGAEIAGFDISKHGLKTAMPEVKKYLFLHRAEKKYPFKDKYFDLVISLNTIHNLPIDGVSVMLSEMERVGKNKYIATEGFRNSAELFNLQCWALTCLQFNTDREWIWLFKHFGYTGDYEFIYFE
jgi:ubiquinone/menaquinone biosynthesis C-methylase UbiE